jgi:hypothetical protein
MSAEQLSLLDTAGMKVRDWYLVYHPRVPWFKWMRHLKQGFRHVELARPVRYGPGFNEVVWLHVLPTIETLDAEIAFDSTPPWERCPNSVVQRVRVSRPEGRIYKWFHFGPVSCVEIAKYALGINSWRIWTPWQLYNFIQRRGGVIVGK